MMTIVSAPCLFRCLCKSSLLTKESHSGISATESSSSRYPTLAQTQLLACSFGFSLQSNLCQHGEMYKGISMLCYFGIIYYLKNIIVSQNITVLNIKLLQKHFKKERSVIKRKNFHRTSVIQSNLNKTGVFNSSIC